MAHGVFVSKKRAAGLTKELELTGVSRRRRPGGAKRKAPETPTAPDKAEISWAEVKKGMSKVQIGDAA